MSQSIQSQNGRDEVEIWMEEDMQSRLEPMLEG